MTRWRIRHSQAVWETTTVWVEKESAPTDEEAEAAIQQGLADGSACVEVGQAVESLDSDIQVDAT